MEIFPYDFSRPIEGLEDVGSYMKAARKTFAGIKATRVKRNNGVGFCIYRIHRDGKTYRGFICTSLIEDYISGKIVKHELTIAEKETRQVFSLAEREAVVKPILLTYQPIPELDSWLKVYTDNTPSDEFYRLDDDVIHEKWNLTNMDSIDKIKGLMAQLDECYIADGHHRSAAMARMYLETGKSEKYNKYMTAYFSLEDLDIFSFHRIITDESKLKNHMKFLLSLKRIFEIKPVFHYKEALRIPLSKHQLMLYYHDEWMYLKWKDSILDQYDKDLLLDVDLFNKHVCSELFEFEDIREDDRIQYMESTNGSEELILTTLGKPNSVAFILPRMSRSEFYKLVSQKAILPPKSTLFKPRLKNGLIVQEL